MKKETLSAIISCCVLLHSNILLAQNEEFAPEKIKAEYYQDEGVKDQLVFDDKKGNTYKVKNSKYTKGLYIKDGDKWLKHGIFYSVSKGKVTSQTTYVMGVKHGDRRSFHSNGKVMIQYNNKEGKKDGQWSHYSDDGSLFEEFVYKDGVKHGPSAMYHNGPGDSTGEKNFVRTYVNGKKHGEVLQYDSKGKLVGRSQYNMGKKVGKTEWHWDK